MSTEKQKMLAITSIITMALVWGVMWYPFRFLNGMGINSWTSPLLVYCVATVTGGICFRQTFIKQLRWQPLLIPLMLTFGWCNFSYVWAITEGEVMRVMLLFYLSPLWTALLSWLVLHEQLTRTGWQVVAASLIGCVVILYKPDIEGSTGTWLSHRYEWLALSGGIAFAFGNVLSRKGRTLPVPIKSACIWIGVILMAGSMLISRGELISQISLVSPLGWAMIAILGCVLCSTSVASQISLNILPVTQVMTLMLMELVFAATTAYFLAGETISLQEWIGTGLIVGSSLRSGKMTHVAHQDSSI